MWTIIGLMSGTSMDGVDAAVLTTDGEAIGGFGPRRFRPYTESEREILRAAVGAAKTLTWRDHRPGIVADAERVVTDAHAEAVAVLMAENGLRPARTAPADGDLRPDADARRAARQQHIDLVGFHGQTVLHAPERGLTVQIGDAAALARQLGLPVVHDFRAADVAAGGQGAPLVPVYHAALAARASLGLPLAIVNIGGVANITRIGGDGAVVAFDTGPGNALLDDFVRRRTGAAMDRDGALAAAGAVQTHLLEGWLAHAFFAKPAPKSLDRNAFDMAGIEALSTEDGAATLTAFTAAAIARGLLAVGGAERVVVAGGGAHNPALRAMLGRLAGIPVETADAHGWDADFIEAEAFAFLAARSLRGLPLSFPGTTGVAVPTTGGRLAEPPPI